MADNLLNKKIVGTGMPELVDERVPGLTRQSNLASDQPESHYSKTAPLEFLPAALRTWVVSSDAFKRIL